MKPKKLTEVQRQMLEAVRDSANRALAGRGVGIDCFPALLRCYSKASEEFRHTVS